ncbi:mevalonate kinase [Carnobacteriaceae bacterium zg-C25]|nr:mevalonate kinase [Carnobacteriaceae bacterium zg-C25]
MLISKQTSTATTGVASGKIILIGEHSAVYAKPAIAMACSAVNVTTTITPSNRGIYLYCDLYEGLLDDIPELLSSLNVVVHETLLYLKQYQPNLHIKIDSNIPLERGMGSSAAVSISVIKALFAYYKRIPTQQELFNLSELSEKLIHGNPSGLDASTIISQKAMWFQKGTTSQEIDMNVNAYLVIADSGITGQTKLAIEKVAHLQNTHPELHNKLMLSLESLTYQTRDALLTKDVHALGAIFNEAHDTLRLLGVSHPTVDHLVAIAQTNGALGAKMTGGGLGGCLFALCDTQHNAQQIAQLFKQYGAYQTFIQSI